LGWRLGTRGAGNLIKRAGHEFVNVLRCTQNPKNTTLNVLRLESARSPSSVPLLVSDSWLASN
jgi:hypothetical protein